jgi:hypothetical protein
MMDVELNRECSCTMVAKHTTEARRHDDEQPSIHPYGI